MHPAGAYGPCEVSSLPHSWGDHRSHGKRFLHYHNTILKERSPCGTACHRVSVRIFVRGSIPLHTYYRASHFMHYHWTLFILRLVIHRSMSFLRNKKHNQEILWDGRWTYTWRVIPISHTHMHTKCRICSYPCSRPTYYMRSERFSIPNGCTKERCSWEDFAGLKVGGQLYIWWNLLTGVI